MLRFIENHDEVRLASMAFAGDAKVAIPAMTLVATMNRGPVMIYGGQEVGERRKAKVDLVVMMEEQPYTIILLCPNIKNG